MCSASLRPHVLGRLIPVCAFFVLGSACVLAGTVENPYRGCRVGDWAEYRYTQQGLPGGGYKMVRTVLATDGKAVRIRQHVTFDDATTHDSEETISLTEPFPLQRLLEYDTSQELDIVQ